MLVSRFLRLKVAINTLVGGAIVLSLTIERRGAELVEGKRALQRRARGEHGRVAIRDITAGTTRAAVTKR